MGNSTNGLKQLLDEQLKLYNQHGFIEKDPISIPHRFSKKQDIEIAGFFAAIFAWGNRTTIINKCNELIQLMDDAPFQFITQHEEIELKRFLSFKHRTFNATDLLHFIRVLRYHYDNQSSAEPTLETAFSNALNRKDDTVENALVSFHDYFFSLEDSPGRTKKHISTPANNSSCKRLNMFLRWMVRKDKAGVDFGIWKNIQPHQLVCPLDVHVQRVARNLNLIQSEKADWKTAVELTEKLKSFDPIDPVKYDIALFSMGVGIRE
ncbi:MAG: hypothetical protein RLZZ204_1232 [Bacteroidota bacterium]|jgi:uncharacterized protein (TIGR02757 family)